MNEAVCFFPYIFVKSAISLFFAIFMNYLLNFICLQPFFSVFVKFVKGSFTVIYIVLVLGRKLLLVTKDWNRSVTEYSEIVRRWTI